MSRELDAEVAEKVMGYKLVDGVIPNMILPLYSLEIAQAWKVVEKMRELGYVFTLNWWRMIEATFDGPIKDDPIIYTRSGETAPKAICRAALAALSRKDQK